MQSKVLFKYTPKEKREANQKALIPVKELVNILVTSYTFSIRRIDQSMPKENLVIRTSLRNKRMVLRGSSSTSSTDTPFSSTLPPGGSSSLKRRWKKGNKRRFAETDKQIKISHAGGVLKGSFQGDTFQIFRCQIMGEFLRPMPRITWFSRPKNKKCSPKIGRFDLGSQFFKGLGKSMNLKKETSNSERKRSGS